MGNQRRKFIIDSRSIIKRKEARALNGTRQIVDVIFAYTNRETDVMETYVVRVNVMEEFPFLVTKLSPYFDR